MESSFTLEFVFADDNPYFSNKVLTKEYTLGYISTDPEVLRADLAQNHGWEYGQPRFEARPKITSCKGCKVRHCVKKQDQIQGTSRSGRFSGFANAPRCCGTRARMRP